MRIRVIDVETSSNDETAEVIQIGWQDLAVEGSAVYLFERGIQRNVAFEGEIAPEAKAVHHITEDDLKGAPDWETVKTHAFSDDADVFAAHNAEFERRFLDPGRPWICTYKVALTLWPDFPHHGNQYLRYKLGYKHDRIAAAPPHHAGPDAYVTAMTLREMLKLRTPDEMIEITEKPILLSRIMFGKHRGTPFSEVPDDYLHWILGQDFDENVKHTAREYLGLNK